MSCLKLRTGLDFSCKKPINKFYQQLVLVNKSDVEIFSVNLDDGNESRCSHRVYFKLKEGKSGFRFSAPETGVSIFGAFEKTTADFIPQYKHLIQFPIVGIDEQVLCVLRNLDNAHYFGALQFGEEIIIYGFENGLTTGDYAFDLQAGFGGSLITISSNDDFNEDLRPLIYKSANGTEIADFDANFEDVELEIIGDFNNDFSDDFFI